MSYIRLTKKELLEIVLLLDKMFDTTTYLITKLNFDDPPKCSFCDNLGCESELAIMCKESYFTIEEED